ncbi:tRNA (adenosine(37)-N6)-threonylcarbamoyltransferase complex ATPase subunit type 1 TsaE [Candidatus Woesebacteria bacterium RIFCSPLOWO2_01_FULL_43_11]|nr:MAG: tRNA (adenosine(37)-N6)-threonylcarbamoyltransferase complex ATPase subunit type 1 TsaE [Candidatus Woesebacteria bacterium RIFCSPLOWO2_01_FULL_43_11]
MEFITKSPGETKKLGKTLANNLTGGEIFALTGNLGSGKTTFVQGFAEGLRVKTRIISPTFILMRRYNIKPKNFYHVDLYRLEENAEKEVVNLGLTDIWGRKENIVVIEWAEKIKGLIPKSAKWITFEDLEGDKRKISI